MGQALPGYRGPWGIDPHRNGEAQRVAGIVNPAPQSKRNPGVGPCDACGQTHTYMTTPGGKRILHTCDPRHSAGIRKS